MKSFKKVLAGVLVGTQMLGVLPVYSAPSEVLGHLTMKKWDYFKTYYDKNGNIRVRPTTSQFSLKNKSQNDTRVPKLKAQDTDYGKNIDITFDTSKNDYKQWQENIFKVTKVDTLTDNPNIEQSIAFKLEDGIIILIGNSSAIDFNGEHLVKIHSSGYDPVVVKIHIVNQAPEIRIHPDFKPVAGQDILFELRNFNYRITNPIYEVILDGKRLEGDCIDYHIVSNLIRLENRGVIQSEGEHTITIRAKGYKDATLKFNVKSNDSNYVAPVKNHEEEISYKSSVKLGDLKIDAMASASGEGGSSGGSLDMLTSLIFDYDMVSNAYILRDLGMETEESRRVLDLWDSAEKDAAMLKDTNRIVSWSGYANAVMNADLEGKHLRFEEYINSPSSESYNNKPHTVKYVLEDGELGDIVPYGELRLKDAKEVKAQTYENDKDLILTFNKDKDFSNGIYAIKVNSKILFDNEYKIEDEKITIDKKTIEFGKNTITIYSRDYRPSLLDVDVFKSNDNIQAILEKDFKIGEDVYIKGLTKDYIGNIKNVILNGKNLLSKEQGGTAGKYKLQLDSLILDESLFLDISPQVLVIESDGYKDQILRFTLSTGKKDDNFEDILPKIDTEKTTQPKEDQEFTIYLDRENPKWAKDAYIVKDSSEMRLSSSKYSINGKEIKIDKSAFSEGNLTFKIKSKGYEDIVFETFVEGTEKLLNPTINVNKKDINLNEKVNISYFDSGEWAAEINKIFANNMELQYTVDESKKLVSLDTKGLSEGKYEIKITANEYEDIKFEINLLSNEYKEKTPPKFDIEQIKRNESIKLPISNWTENITSIYIESEDKKVSSSLTKDDYYKDTSNGRIIIDGSNFDFTGWANITIKSEGYKDFTHKLMVEDLSDKNIILAFKESKVRTGQEAAIEYKDTPMFYNNTINKVKINGKEVPKDKYTVNTVGVKIDGSNFKKAGEYEITVEAEEYKPVILNLEVVGADIEDNNVEIKEAPIVKEIKKEFANADINISFKNSNEYKVWKDKITKIYINGVEITKSNSSWPLDKSSYYASPIQICIQGDIFSNPQLYEIVIEADGYEDLKCDYEKK